MAKHMTLEERKVLEARYNAGQSVPGIANAIVSTTVEASKTIQDKLVENGYGDYVSVINILNDVDHDYVLCTASMGALLYDCTE